MDRKETEKDNFKETRRGTGKNRDTVPVTGIRGQEERDESSVITSKIHNVKRR